MNTNKKPSLIAAIGTVRTMREEMIEKCGDTVKDYIAAVDRIIDYLVNPDDRTITNLTLYVTGGICALLGLCCGICGAVYVFMANLPAAQTLGLYAAGFGGFGWLCFKGVRR